MTVDVIYLADHDNIVRLVLKEDGTGYDLSNVTKITATFGDVLVTSENAATGVITWAQAGYATGEIRLDLAGNLGAGTTLTASKSPYKVPIVTYEPSYARGIVWGKHPILVEAEVEAS